MTQMAQMQKSAEKRDLRTFAIIGAAMDVHKQLGCGLLEAVYQEALALEFAAQNVPHRREAESPIHYRGQKLNVTYRADFLCFGSVSVKSA
jgi:GxxExxY protein